MVYLSHRALEGLRDYKYKPGGAQGNVLWRTQPEGGPVQAGTRACSRMGRRAACRLSLFARG